MSAPALPTICPRCLRRLVRNHDELVCLTHGQVFEPIRAWETAAAVVASGVTERGGKQKRVRGMSPTAVPWTNEERELWRRAEAGEEFAPPEPKEEEPMSEFAPKSADDLGGPALARLRELAAQVEKAEALAHSLRAEALRFVQVLDLLGVDFPEQLRVAARAKASPLSKTKTPVPEGDRWACACGFRAVGRYPGGHPAKCPLKRVAA
jgi:hypothetical protein